MSADLNTSVTLFGTVEELAAMLMAIQSFEKDSYDEHKKLNYRGGYIQSSRITSPGGKKRLELSGMTQDAICKFVKKRIRSRWISLVPGEVFQNLMKSLCLSGLLMQHLQLRFRDGRAAS